MSREASSRNIWLYDNFVVASGIALALYIGASAGKWSELNFGLIAGIVTSVATGSVCAVMATFELRTTKGSLAVALACTIGPALEAAFLPIPHTVLIIVSVPLGLVVALSALLVVGGTVVTAVGSIVIGVVDVVKHRVMRSGRATEGHRITESAARGLALIAVWIGGSSRAWRIEEFLADVTRLDESRPRPSRWGQIRHGAGLVRAALILRACDFVRPLARIWLRLLDWALAKPRAEWIVTALTAFTAVYFLQAGGFSCLMTNLQNVGTVALLIGPALWLRKCRDVPPARRRVESDKRADSAQR